MKIIEIITVPMSALNQDAIQTNGVWSLSERKENTHRNIRR